MAAILALFAGYLLFGCEPANDAGPVEPAGLAVAPGLSIPNFEELADKVERTSADIAGRTRVREDGRTIDRGAFPGRQRLSATVGSFDEKTGVAHIAVRDAASNMPLVQAWRFDGESWSQNIDGAIVPRDGRR